MLATELQMFDDFYNHVESKIQYSVVVSVDRRASASISKASSDVNVRKRTRSRQSKFGQLHLTAEQKCDVAQRELRVYAEEVRIANEDSEKQLNELKVSDKLLIVVRLGQLNVLRP